MICIMIVFGVLRLLYVFVSEAGSDLRSGVILFLLFGCVGVVLISIVL